MAIVYLTNPIAKSVYATFMAVAGLMALDSKPWVGLLFWGVSALVFWNATQLWKAAKKAPRT